MLRSGTVWHLYRLHYNYETILRKRFLKPNIYIYIYIGKYKTTTTSPDLEITVEIYFLSQNLYTDLLDTCRNADEEQ